MDKLSEIFAKVDPQKKIFTEEIQNEFKTLIEAKKEEAYKRALEEAAKKVSEDHTAEIKKLTESIDNDHSAKLQKLIEKIDLDHARKLKKIYESLDTHCSKKLVKVVKHLKENHRSQIIEKVSDYLDTYLEEAFPKKNAIDEAKLARLEESTKAIREILMVNDAYVQKEIKEAILDAKKQIEEKQSEVDKLMFEKVELKKKFDKIEADRMLTEKTKDMPLAQKSFILKYFAEATSKEISEKMNEAVQAFQKADRKERETLIEKNANAGIKPTVVMDESDKQMLTEKTEVDGNTNLMSTYAAKVKRSFGLNQIK